MAQRNKGGKGAKADPGVLGGLPSARPQRVGRARDRPPAPAAEAMPRPARTAGPKPKTPAKPKPAAKPKAAEEREPAPTPRAAPDPVPTPEPRGPRPVRPGAPDLPDDTTTQARPDASPSGTELASTVVKAAGELAQIGLTVGGQVLKRAVQRLPKP